MNPTSRWLRIAGRVADAAFPVLMTLLILAASAAVLAGTCGCSAADRRAGAAVTSGVSSGVAVLAPVVCSIVSAVGGDATACGPIAENVADVAALVSKILGSWSRSAARPMAPPVVLVIRGVSVTLHPEAAAYVQAQMGAAK